MPARCASSASVGARSAPSINRHSPATSAACGLAGSGRSGWQRLHGLKPARSASAAVAWNATFSGRARREGHEGRQYTPVLRTE